MTTKETDAAETEAAQSEQLERLNENLAKVEELSSRLVAAFSRKKSVPASLQGPGQDLYMKAAAAYMAEMMSNPSKILEHQISFWGKSLKHYVEAQQALAQGKLAAPPDETPDDRRFSNPLWQSHPYFNFIKQQYLMNAEAMEQAIGDLEGLDAKEKKRGEYFSRQIVDMFSPTNFLGTNPEALSRAVETDGASLVQGLENLVRDIEANDGDVVVTLADKEAFQVGKNLATTEGSVVYRNRMFELIQYAPSTEKVQRTPLIVFPPWINKFYILDLKQKNSLINWIVAQGYTLFVVSWKNPDASYADVSLDDYVEQGYLAAINEVKAITGEAKVNAVGYCIAGTTLAATMALLKRRGDTSIKSATFFTALTDFSEQGEFTPFLEDDFVDAIERQVAETGILESHFMSRTFSYLRANDLIYGPAVRSYMLGEAPPAFDLLHWNGDSTNLPGKMAVQYLRDLCQDNKLAHGTLELLGESLSLDDVQVPVCSIACETDHIAAWRDCYRGFTQMASKNKTFVLSQSGHIAGIVNPPSKGKYGHYTSDDYTLEPEAWQAAAEFTPGSWWPRWEVWLKKQSGRKVAAREIDAAAQKKYAAAPGDYAREPASF